MRIALLLVALAGSAVAQTSRVDTIFAGVSRIVGQGVPGPVLAYEGSWAALVAGDADTPQPSLVAVAREFGNGRVVAHGVRWTPSVGQKIERP
ncbi:MAG: hypothetical protein LC130_17135 [Bryobacterales bacterium]|nr:hypothetical protein [Bryobacterales bacterium]